MEKNGTLTLEQLTNKIEGYQEKIDALRLDGTLKFHRLKDENDKIRHNKNISKEDKQSFWEILYRSRKGSRKTRRDRWIFE